MSDDFYRAFEERHRGSRELIKGRVAAYLPFVEPLLITYPSAPTVDLGCGRGEWLELLVEAGFKPMGVDLDKGMLEACLERGLSVEQGDALAYISALPDESLAVASAFHVVEHLTFDQLRILVAEALRVLKPGGLLIMETPNPENIVVATCSFYLDPTHQRPIPSELLAFVAEHAGFARVKTLRLQESKELIDKVDLRLRDVFAGASPDYAVVAQKIAPDELMALTNEAFGTEYGLSLDNLLARWEGRFDRLETKAQQAETKAQQAETKAQQAETKAQQAETKAQQAETKAQQAEAASNERLAQLQAVFASSSWKITRPLRGIKRMLSGVFAVLGQLTTAVKFKAKQTFRPVVSSCIAYVLQRPLLRNIISPCLKSFPALHRRFLRVAENTGLVERGGGDKSMQFMFVGNSGHSSSQHEQTITPRARQIYQDLKIAIENKNKGVV